MVVHILYMGIDVWKFHVLAGYIFLPVALVHLLVKAIKQPVYAARWLERLGIYHKPCVSGGIWLHACSVGEVESSIPLIQTLQQHYPDIPCLVTTTTPTGSERIINAFGNNVQHVYLPFDVSFAVKSFLAFFKPVVALIVEKEIWPNLFLRCQENGIPLLLINAMISDRSFHRYRYLDSFFKPVFQSISKIGAQTTLDAQQFAQLGVAPESIDVTGNLKFQRIVSEHLYQQAKELRQQLFGARPIWIVASTHANEESLLLDHWSVLLSTIPDLLMILAPRHPQRGNQIYQYCKKNTIPCVTRSSGLSCSKTTRVFLLDTLGELMLFYGVSDVAFVGGSLVHQGCHNVLEPAAWGLPVVFGRSIYNCEEIAAGLVAADAAISVENAAQCVAVVGELLLDHHKRHSMGINASCYVNKQQDQLTKTVDMIDLYLTQLSKWQ